MKKFADRAPHSSIPDHDFTMEENNFPRRQLKSGGSNFHSERFLFQSDRITVVPTKSANLIFWIFLSIGFVVLIAGSLANQVIPLLVFAPVMVLFACLIKFALHQNHADFDLQNKLFYPCGRTIRKKYIAPIPFPELSRLYILKKECRGSKGSRFFCYELNIVLKNGEQYNLLNHGSQKGILDDAEQLASALNLPYSQEGMVPPMNRLRKDSSVTALFIIGTVFLLIGGCASYAACIRPLSEYIECQSWVETPAVVRVSHVQSHRGKKETHHSLIFSYAYTWQGRQFESKKYDCFADQLDNYSHLRQIVRENPPGTGILCYVNPEEPSQAVAKKNFSFAILPMMLFVHIFPVVGIVLLTFGIRKYRQKKREQQ